jgi:hypothetical protein
MCAVRHVVQHTYIGEHEVLLRVGASPHARLVVSVGVVAATHLTNKTPRIVAESSKWFEAETPIEVVERLLFDLLLVAIYGALSPRQGLRKVERAGLWIYSNMSQALADVARGARLVASGTTCRWRLQAANYCRRIMSCIPNTYITEFIEFYIHTYSWYLTWSSLV